jgi:hypothetical protein
MTLPVARTRDEARLYLDLTPCECGAVDADWQHATGVQDGDLVSVYDATCEQCGVDREYAFGLPAKETAGEFPNFGADEPSQLIDAGRWIALADQLAGALPPDDPQTTVHAMRIAVAAVDEVIKFVPPHQDAVPPSAFWTPEGRAVYDANPGRFHRRRLEFVRDTYRT